MKIKDILNPAFGQALDYLIASRELDGRVAFRITKFKKEIDKELASFSEVMKQILEYAAKKGEDGKPVIEDNRYVFPDVDAANEALSSVNSIMEDDLDIKLITLKLSEIEKAKLSPNDMLALFDLIEE